MIEPYQLLQIQNNVSKIIKRYDKKLASLSLNCIVCYNVEISAPLTDFELRRLVDLLTIKHETTSDSEKVGLTINLCSSSSKENIIKQIKTLENPEVNRYAFTVEIGPRLNFCTPYSTNAVCVCMNVNLLKITRIEVSYMYFFGHNTNELADNIKSEIIESLYDRMTEVIYGISLQSFNNPAKQESIFYIDIINEGKGELEKINTKMGLAMDDWDLNYYYNLFREKIGRNPTNIECFDLAQSNSEHSRHWFFRGQFTIDGELKDESLFKMIMNTQKYSNENNVVAFSDNSSAIKGFNVPVLVLTNPFKPSIFKKTDRIQHISLTAETHNFPTGIAPHPGAATGTGGRIRDVQAIGRGGRVVAGTAGYCVGISEMNWLQFQDRSRNWDCGNMAHAREILIEASNGASEYGNKFGEPVISGFCRSFGMKVGQEWREWVKPIMFSGGIGQVYEEHVKKCVPMNEDLVVKIGGPVYRIGVGGGAASSVEVQGDTESRDTKLDFGAVQRGDPQMENKMNRVVQGAIDLGVNNPIRSIHDQGAGGNGNVLKELVEPLGAVINPDAFKLGDPTINLLELWGAEYQESNGVLISKSDIHYLRVLCDRERCPLSVVGCVTGDGRIKLTNWTKSKFEQVDLNKGNGEPTLIEYPVDLDLDVVLGKMPKKEYNMRTVPKILEHLKLPDNLQFEEALTRTLLQPSVGSKRFLTNKVDRSVTGLVAQQQCVGPLHTPLADVAVVALSPWSRVGAATSIGEQPIKMLLNEECGARMTLVEALSNLVAAPITCMEDIKMSGNWMWAAKLPGEGASLYKACRSLCNAMRQLGVAIDGGKDSLSMAASVRDIDTGDTMVVKAPGELVVSAYAACTNVTRVLTPDLKGDSLLYWIRPNIQHTKHWRLGGSALAQAHNQVGHQCPDIDDLGQFKRMWLLVQVLMRDQIISSIHDISDGGFITAVLEMAFAGNISCDININLPEASADWSSILFSEEAGWIVEVDKFKVDFLDAILAADRSQFLSSSVLLIGESGRKKNIGVPTVNLVLNGKQIIKNTKLAHLRGLWEESSYQLEKFQCNEDCVEQEYSRYRDTTLRSIDSCDCYHIPSELMNNTTLVDNANVINSPVIRVAILREEGSNGDKEMAVAFMKAGFECWDVTMQDILQGTVNLKQFRGIAFVGGFSYGDVLGAGRGWAASIAFHDKISAQFTAFYHRKDTFSLGVCNGCQLMVHLGWLTADSLDVIQPSLGSFIPAPVTLVENESGRFESRFSVVHVPMDTCSMMLRGLRGCRLGIWVAHGEGRFQINDEAYLSTIKSDGQFALQYTMPGISPSNSSILPYPNNPNGSTHNLAGLCSVNGRHLALMPHPERTINWWQWPYAPNINGAVSGLSPWFSMFQEAYKWCVNYDADQA